MIQIINNLVGVEYTNKIQSTVLNNDFPWFYLNTATPDDESPLSKDINGNDYINAPIFRHWLFINDKINSTRLSIFDPFIQQLIVYFNKNLIIKTCTLNLTTPNEKLLGRYGNPHIDVWYQDQEFEKYDTYTGVYYLNNADGNTLLYDQVYVDFIPDKFTLNKSIEPQADKFVFWKSRRYHSAPAGCSSVRLILNINFMIEK